MNKKLPKLAEIVFFILIITFVSSCRKGDEDPFLTLRSRDNRITNVWNLEKIVGTSVETEVDNDSVYRAVTTVNYNGTSFSSITNYNNSTTPDTNIFYTSYSETLEILEGGRYILTTRAINRDNDDITNSTSLTEGYWTWGSTTKNKTQLVLDGVIIFDVLRLSKKELILKMVSNMTESGIRTTSFGVFSGSEATVEDFTYTYVSN